MTFLGNRIEEALVWFVRCKGCGEVYLIREVGGAEVSLPAQIIACRKTEMVYEYPSSEIGEIWVP